MTLAYIKSKTGVKWVYSGGVSIS